METGKNLGFGQANNLGLQLAIEHKADHVFLLNQDAWVETDTIARLVEAQQQHPEFGIISPVHLNGAGTAPDAHFLQYLMQAGATKKMIADVLLNTPPSLRLMEVPFVNAAAWLISAACLQKTGGFDAIFFHYGEDINYAQRVLFHGFRIGIHPLTKIYHDRETRIAKPPTPQSILKNEWIHFLNQACDIQQPRYLVLATRRFFRYSLQLLVSLCSFNRMRVNYNFFMVKKIALSLFDIGKSRAKAVRTDSIPHL
jgi:GT2 family glycosyltransferase